MTRLHQRGFRERVLAAYQTHCAMCHLRHRELLDAAHILADADGGEPVVSNGLSLCKGGSVYSSVRNRGWESRGTRRESKVVALVTAKMKQRRAG